MNHPLPDPEILYTALLHRDSTFEGIFVVGVKTTGVAGMQITELKEVGNE